MKAWLLLGAAALLLAGCAGMRTQADFDRKADFSHLHSYAWMPEVLPAATAAVDDGLGPLNRQRVIDAVDTLLQGRGYVPAPTGATPDFLIAFTAGARDRIAVYSTPSPAGYPWWWGGWPYFGQDIDARSYREGHLSIDIYEGPSRRPIWHGTATKELSSKDEQQAQTLIPQAVQAILAPFPPR